MAGIGLVLVSLVLVAARSLVAVEYRNHRGAEEGRMTLEKPVWIDERLVTSFSCRANSCLTLTGKFANMSFDDISLDGISGGFACG